MIYDPPYLRTQVVHAKSQQPIANARAEVWATQRVDLGARGASDPQGEVFIAPLTHEAHRYGPYAPAGRVRVWASGYLETEASVSFGAGRTPTIGAAAGDVIDSVLRPAVYWVREIPYLKFALMPRPRGGEW